MKTFFIQGLKHLYQVGTVVPSSRWLARSMIRNVHNGGSPKRVLEVGAGTGAVTRRILPLLNDGDEFHVVEINPSFCRHVEKRVLDKYRRSHPGVRITMHRDSITSAALDGKFDAVVCTLPFRAFTPDVVLDILDALVNLTADRSDVTFMQYAGVRFMLWPFVSRTRSRELRRIDAICRWIERSKGGSREFVPLNILPSFVVRFTAGANTRSGRRWDRRHAQTASANGTRAR